MALDGNSIFPLYRTEKTYLCAEFGKSFFIQICLFIDSGFVPELKSRKGGERSLVFHESTFFP